MTEEGGLLLVVEARSNCSVGTTACWAAPGRIPTAPPASRGCTRMNFQAVCVIPTGWF